MAIDTKKMKDLKSTFEGLKFLIVDGNSSTRNALRKILGSTGIPSTQIEASDNFLDAKELILKKSYNSVIADYEIGNQDGFEILRLARTRVTHPLKMFTAIITSKNTGNMISTAVENDVDCIFLKPFTSESITRELFKVFEEKANPSYDYAVMSLAKDLLNQGKQDDALNIYLKLIQENKAPTSAYYRVGEIHRLKSDMKTARQFLTKALSRDPQHYLSLVSFLEIELEEKNFKEAYLVAKRAVEKHPLPPKRIPDLVKLSIQNGAYNDMDAFYSIFTQTEIEDRSELMTISVSAGLVIAGRVYLKQGDHDKARNSFQTAITISIGKKSIHLGVLRAYFFEGRYEAARQYFEALPTNAKTEDEAQILNIRSLYQLGAYSRVIPAATEYLKNSIGSIEVYEALVKSSIAEKRRESIIEELKNDAKRHFKDKASEITSW